MDILKRFSFYESAKAMRDDFLGLNEESWRAKRLNESTKSAEKGFNVS